MGGTLIAPFFALMRRLSWRLKAKAAPTPMASEGDNSVSRLACCCR
jgi:hypothetical protein